MNNHEARTESMVTTPKFQILLALAIMFAASARCTVSPPSTTQSPDCVSRKALVNLKLILAAELGRVEVVNTMIKAGADVNASDELFGTPVVAAATGGNYYVVKLLLNNGANVNATDAKGYTALMRATQSGNAEMVRQLLSDGAEPNVSSSRPTGALTALSIAKSKNNEEIMKLLTDAGAKE